MPACRQSVYMHAPHCEPLHFVYAELRTMRSVPYCSCWSYAHRMTQHPLPLSLLPPLSRLCLVAASKTSSTPSPVRLEHSRYFFAPIRFRTSSPSSGVRNFSERFRISSWATGSSRRSFLSPTRIMGTFGHRSRTSGCLLSSQYHSTNVAEEGWQTILW